MHLEQHKLLPLHLDLVTLEPLLPLVLYFRRSEPIREPLLEVIWKLNDFCLKINNNVEFSGTLFGANNAPGFGGTGNMFGSGTTGFGTANTNFGAGTAGFGTGSAPAFGAGNTGFGANTGGFGTTFNSNVPSFGGSTGLGSFGVKPLGAGTTGFGGFGANLGGTSFGQIQQPPVSLVNEYI